MRNAMLCLVGLAALVVLVLFLRRDDGLALADVPEPVLAAVRKKYPKADIVEARKEGEGADLQYILTLHQEDNGYEVTLSPAGEILEIAVDIEPEDLPRAVKEAIQKRYPKATIEDAAEVTDQVDEDRLSFYVEIRTAKGRTVEMMFDPKGEILKDEGRTRKK